MYIENIYIIRKLKVWLVKLLIVIPIIDKV